MNIYESRDALIVNIYKAQDYFMNIYHTLQATKIIIMKLLTSKI